VKRFVTADIHGRFKALKEVLKLSKFDYAKDKLIILGDVVDGGINTYKVVEELLKIKNLVFVMGNHDEFFMNHIASGWSENVWIHQGGENTIKSYGGRVKVGKSIYEDSIITKNINIPVTHQDFFNRAVMYHIENEMLFVHGGIAPKKSIVEQDKHTLLYQTAKVE